ncbi:DNA starvation/stationary phase protection protein [Aureibaculum marinum]|uniref:DNA starvation/stationary phase protection protein n=1 Tax=Aureibaculum marinum TaxID=2487930 RepID=A0A3N4NQI6_9FLAO|nr:Dps family protein [Aureibaculum marinum]RPD98642.1 DNA starvation/stationary phase protection protein [Aureibaculum marinum]
MNTKILGLSESKINELAEDLNILLANYQVYYQSLRGLHWNIKGKNFFQLHEKFEELYNDSQVKIDEVAERILTLEGTPLHTFDDYSKLAKVPVGKNISKDVEAVNLVVSSLKEIIQIERAILDKSAEADDEGTNAMMSDFISEQEKTIWMFKSWLA